MPTLPTAPKRENFSTELEWEEAVGFYRSRMSRLVNLAGVKQVSVESKSNERTEPLRLDGFINKYTNALRPKNSSDLSLIQLVNFLGIEHYKEMKKRETDLLMCASDDKYYPNNHTTIYFQFRGISGDSGFSEYVPSELASDPNANIILKERLAEKIYIYASRQAAYINSIVKNPLAFSIIDVLNDYASLVRSSSVEIGEIYNSYDIWLFFCQDYLRLCSYWEFTGALLYGHARDHQLLLFFYATQGEWVVDRPTLLKTGNSQQFQSELARLSKKRNILFRLFS